MKTKIRSKECVVTRADPDPAIVALEQARRASFLADEAEYAFRMLRCTSNVLLGDTAMSDLHRQLIHVSERLRLELISAYRTTHPRPPVVTDADRERVSNEVREALTRRPCVGHACFKEF